MIDNILNLLFRCSHRRLTRPVTPVNKRGVKEGTTYVVCLDCGKQFAYDLNEMRVGKPIAVSAIAGVLEPELARSRRTKLRYAAWASAISAGWFVGRAVMKRKKTPDTPEKSARRAGLED